MDTPSAQGPSVSTLDIPIRLLRVVPYRNIKRKTRNYDHRTLNLDQQRSRGLYMEYSRWQPFVMKSRLLIMGLFVILSCSAKKETKGNIQNFNETKKEIITDSVIYKKEIFHSFSSLDSKDLFRIYVTGKSLVKGEVHFQIIVNHMNLILDETFSAFGDLGYYMSELKSLGQQELTSQEQEEYIKKTLDDFFDEKAFDYPAAGPSNISVFKSPEKEIWKEIISDKSSIGFTYGVGYQDGRQIAYSRKLKKAVILVQCC